MKRGLVIGKFLPLHKGHIALVRFAVSQCDELSVSMSFTSNDPIDPVLRFSWLTDTFKNESKVRTEMVLDDFDDESLPMVERTKIWADFIKKRFPNIDLIFSSEEYGEPLGTALGVSHVAFDLQRRQVPVSAMRIREKPFFNWDYIPEVVRPYFVKKVCFYGPESTGKSSMAKHFAEIYKTEYVPEVAREMITSNTFSVEDIVNIGIAQTRRVMEKVKTANKILFCDTDLITTQIYSEHYLHVVPPVLFELERQVTYDLYFLFDIDVPWVADGLRDLDTKREEMYSVFKLELDKRGILYHKIRGTWKERERQIQIKLDEWH